MKSFLTLAFLVFYSGLGFSQKNSILSDNDKNEQRTLVIEAGRESLRIESFQPIDELLRSGKITDTELRMELLDMKIQYYYYNENLYQPTNYRWKNKVVIQDSLDAYLRFTDSVIDLADCIWKAHFMHSRYKAVEKINLSSGYSLGDDITNFLKSEKKKIKFNGGLPERTGFGLGIGYMKGIENWVGAEFTILNLYFPSFSYHYSCDGRPMKYQDSSVRSGFNYLNFGYYTSMNSNIHDFSFSLTEMYNPLVIIPAKFGYQKNIDLQMNSYYYRPSIGLGLGPVGIYYSYNLMFSKEMRAHSERHLLQIRINYPVFRAKYAIEY